MRMLSKDKVLLLLACGTSSFVGLSTAAAQAPPTNWTGASLYGGIAASKLDGDVSLTDTTEYSLETNCDKIPDNSKPITQNGECGNTNLLKVLFGDGFSPLFKDIAQSFVNKASSSLDGDFSVTGTIGAGFDFEPFTGVVAGGFADIDWSDADADFSGEQTSTLNKKLLKGLIDVEKTATTSFKGQLDYDYSYTVGGRLGFLTLDRQALIYVLGGYTRLETDGYVDIKNSVDVDVDFDFFGHSKNLFNSSFAGDSFRVRLPDSFDGFTVGVGTEVKLTGNFSLKLEGRYSDFGSETAAYSSASSKSKVLDVYKKDCGSGKDCAYTLTKSAESQGSLKIDPEIWSARVALSYRFN